MKLAEAIMLRADQQKRINSLLSRLRENARVRHDDEPVEDPNTLLEQLRELLENHSNLVNTINATNAVTTVEEDMTISEALAKREYLNRLHGSLMDVAQAAATERDRWMDRGDTKMVPTVDVAALRGEADDLGQQIRELNAKIQQTNWNTEI